MIRRATQQVLDWCEPSRGALHPSRVAILVAGGRLDGWPKEIGNHKVVQTHEAWRAGKGILLITARRFKGLEAEAIVLASGPRAEMHATTADHYVTVSRARMLLVEVVDVRSGA